MSYDQLQEINSLVYYVWDAAALVCFQGRNQPLRYSEVGAALAEWGQRRPSDSDLTRLLNRLHDAGLVSRNGARRRDHIYALTPTGHKQATKIAALIKALQANTLA
ncbi:hypothetical protein GCM10023322_68580 [Rugosimonospora acidiphila]|uniref:Uncharacterized protein n=1 Tax=Rugosimonospora acidiphila TaxID=556531 RepID=A0ABP9SKD0_9ACTN